MNGADPTGRGPVHRLDGSVARLLRGAAVVLALLFVLRVLVSLAPPQAGLPAMLLRLCEAMVTQAPFAVLVVCLIGLSLLIDAECRSSRRLARLLRSAALPLAFAYLLLIPLYVTTQWGLSQSDVAAQRQGLQSSLQQLRDTQRSLRRASSSEQLQRIWANLPPGSPPLTRFGSTPGQQRTALIGFLDQVNGILSARLNGMEQRRMLNLSRDSALYALACLGLATLFYRCTLLDRPSRQRWNVQPDAAAGRSRQACRRGPLDGDLKRLLHASGVLASPDSEPIDATASRDHAPRSESPD